MRGSAVDQGCPARIRSLGHEPQDVLREAGLFGMDTRAPVVTPGCLVWLRGVRRGSGASGAVPGHVTWLRASGVDLGLGLAQVPDAQAARHGAGHPFLDAKPAVAPAHRSPLPALLCPVRPRGRVLCACSCFPEDHMEEEIPVGPLLQGHSLPHAL